MKLVHKGLLFVVLLLTMELFFVGVLWRQLQQTEAAAQELAHSKMVLGATDYILDVVSAYNRKLVWDSKYLDQAIRKYPVSAVVKAIEPKLAELRSLVGANPGRLKQLDEIDMLLRDEEKDLSLVEQFIKSSGPNYQWKRSLIDFSVVGATQRAERRRDVIFEKLIAFGEPERKVEANSPQVEANLRDSLRQGLIGGIVFNVFLAIAFAVVFVQAITQRLVILVDNTKRLVKRESLQPLMKGNDEIAVLDAAFHRMEQTLRETEEKEREIQKMKEEFVAMASHELRSPLTSIAGVLEMLELGKFGELPDGANQRIRRAGSNVQRLIGLINDVLDTEKMKAGKLELSLEAQDIWAAVNPAVAAVGDLAESRQITLEAKPFSAVVRCDTNRMIQVFVNLLSNALKFSPKGTTVAIRAHIQDCAIEIHVIDEGVGIAAADRERIFEKFEQAAAGTDKRASTGLGLAIAREIVQGHGGELGVTSSPGAGSDFWIRLPLTEAPLHVVPLARQNEEAWSEEA